jgi:hypothetical protein
MLTTRYPGLRRLFLNPQQVGNSEDDISARWERPQEACDLEWDLFCNFAAACLADGDMSSMVEEAEEVEERQPKRLVSRLISPGAEGKGLSVIERLLVAADCW